MPFSDETMEFLVQNRMEDSRAWFHEHHKEYQKYVIEPLRDLVMDLTPTMLKIDDQFVVEPRVDRTISRIWRDTRFTKDPSLYRQNMWIIFKRDRMHSTEYPAMYFEVTPDRFFYGCGYYHASPSFMRTLREDVLANTSAFRAAQKAYRAQDIFQLEGELYKRPHYPDQPAEIADWLERKELGFYAESEDFDLLYSDRLGAKLAEDLAKIGPVYRFMLDVAIRENQQTRDKRF